MIVPHAELTNKLRDLHFAALLSSIAKFEIPYQFTINPESIIPCDSKPIVAKEI